jgi:hypothetical protein
MSAASYEYRPEMTQPAAIGVWGTMSTTTAFYGALVMSILFAFIVFIATLTDLRARYYNTIDQLDRAERLLYKMNDNCYSTAIRHYIDRKKAGVNGESYMSNKLSSAYVLGHADEPLKQAPLVQLDRSLLAPATEIKSPENSFRKSYSEQRVGPAHEHPSLADAMHDYRVPPPALLAKKSPILLSTDNRLFFGSDHKIACAPGSEKSVAEIV